MLWRDSCFHGWCSPTGSACRDWGWFIWSHCNLFTTDLHISRHRLGSIFLPLSQPDPSAQESKFPETVVHLCPPEWRNTFWWGMLVEENWLLYFFWGTITLRAEECAFWVCSYWRFDLNVCWWSIMLFDTIPIHFNLTFMTLKSYGESISGKWYESQNYCMMGKYTKMLLQLRNQLHSYEVI